MDEIVNEVENDRTLTEDEMREIERREKFENLARELSDLEIALSTHGLSIRALIASVAKHQHGVVIAPYVKPKLPDANEKV